MFFLNVYLQCSLAAANLLDLQVFFIWNYSFIHYAGSKFLEDDFPNK